MSYYKSHLTFALEHMDFYRSLIISRCGEHLALLSGDCGVALNQFGEHAAHCLDAQTQGGNVQQQQALYIAAKDTALNGSAYGHAFIGVDAFESILSGDLLDGLLNCRDTARSRPPAEPWRGRSWKVLHRS